MSFEIKRANRAGLKPLIGFYGKSGSGKTMSALLLARGLVGPSGRIVMIDSENGRGSIFSDIIPGGYEVLDLDPPFTPERYHEAIEVADKAADCVVIDSYTHEWAGEGGVLDMQESELDRMAGANWSKREACKMAAWIKPKMIHKKLTQRVLRCRAAMIVCLRGEEKTHMSKGVDGKTKVITDEFSSPIADPRFIFEMLVNFETVARDGQGGYVIPRKITHPAIASLLPTEGQQIGVAHGEAIARWCAKPADSGPAQAPVTAAKDPVKEMKTELWNLTLAVHHKDKRALEQWLWDEMILSDTEGLEELTPDRLKEVLGKTKERLSEKAA